MTKEFHSVLGISPAASREELRRAYYKLVKQYHPDRNPGKRAFYEKQLKQINEAYTELKRTKAMNNNHKTMTAHKKPTWFSEIVDLFRKSHRNVRHKKQ